MRVRAANEAEIDHLAHIWFDGWQDAHAQILPPELARHRTLESFRGRLQSLLPHVRIVSGDGQPLGFCITEGDELYQLYVSAGTRGRGIAKELLEDAEALLRSHGVEKSWLACAIGNERAARFYEKQGWCRVGSMVNELPTPEGVFPLEVWRYEKDLAQTARPSVGVAHVVMYTDRMEASAKFMRFVGMRPIFDGPEVSVYEMRGGTHLILMLKDDVAGGAASFDLMLDDLHQAHERFKAAGFEPSPIEARPVIDHELFTVREPVGNIITFFSSHASGWPI